MIKSYSSASPEVAVSPPAPGSSDPAKAEESKEGTSEDTKVLLAEFGR